MGQSSSKRIVRSHVRWAPLASAALVLAGCSDGSYTPPREGQRVGEFPRDPWVLRLKPELVLSIPSSHHGVWQRQKDPPRLPVDVQSLPVADAVGFLFFMPDFSGYTPDTVLRQFSEQRVNVIIRAGDMEQLRPGATGEYPPNMRERILGGDPEQTEMQGLVCYSPRNDVPKNRQLQCFGRSDRGAGDVDIFIRASIAPADALFPYPQMMAAYFTPRYGGLSVTWHTNAVNLPRWREIDQQVWRFVAAWKVAQAR